MMIERDSKTTEKEIDRMLKVIPYFNGDSIDNFESWVLHAKKTLSYTVRMNRSWMLFLGRLEEMRWKPWSIVAI